MSMLLTKRSMSLLLFLRTSVFCVSSFLPSLHTHCPPLPLCLRGPHLRRYPQINVSATSRNVAMDTTSRQYKEISPTRTREPAPPASPGTPDLERAPAQATEGQPQPPTERLVDHISALLSERSDAIDVFAAVGVRLGLASTSERVPALFLSLSNQATERGVVLEDEPAFLAGALIDLQDTVGGRLPASSGLGAACASPFDSMPGPGGGEYPFDSVANAILSCSVMKPEWQLQRAFENWSEQAARAAEHRRLLRLSSLAPVSYTHLTLPTTPYV